MRHIIFLLIFSSLVFGKTIQSDQLGYSIELSENWILADSADNHHLFLDPTGQYRALIGIKRVTISDLFENERDWCIKSNYSYTLWVEGDHPLGVVYLFDTLEHDGNFGMFANAMYLYLDEHNQPHRVIENSRHVGVEGYGYHLYVHADTSDMYTHEIFYSSVLNSIKLFGNNLSAHQNRSVHPIVPEVFSRGSNYLFLLNGRRMDLPHPSNKRASLLTVTEEAYRFKEKLISGHLK